MATIHNNSVVAKGDLIGAARIVPLTAENKDRRNEVLIERMGRLLRLKHSAWQ